MTLYYVKYGYLPFFSKEEEKLMEKIKKEPVNLPSSESDEDFINLVHALLDKDPSKRITVEQLCVHCWITDHGRLQEIQFNFVRTNVNDSDQRKVMSKLMKMSPSESDENTTTMKERCQSAYKLSGIKEKWQLAGRRLSGLSLPLSSITEQREANKELLSTQACNDSPCSNDTSIPSNASSLQYLLNQDVPFSNTPRVSKLGLQKSASLNVNSASTELNTAYLKNMAPITWTWTRNERGSKNLSPGINGKLSDVALSGEPEIPSSNIELMKSPEVDFSEFRAIATECSEQ